MGPKRKRRGVRAAEDSRGPSRSQGCLALLGLLCFFVAVLLFDTTRRAFGIWHWQGGYARTELEVLSASPRGRARVEGRVRSTGADLWVDGSRLPELMRTENGVVFTLDTPARLVGRRAAVWFNPQARNVLFGDLRVLSAANGEPPGLDSAAGYLAVLLGFVGVSVLLLRPVLRKPVS